MKKYQVFVSYRRDGGDMLAGRVADNLTQRGYRVFFDVEAMRSGEFNEQIYEAIDGCTDFIIILSTTPNALERCKNEGDWVRRELAYALKKGKNIIPVLARDYTFPEVLPEDIEGIRTKQGIHASRDFFPEAMDRLEGYLKAGKTSARRSGSQKAARDVAAPVKPEIRLPLFLKTPPSSFMQRNQHLVRMVNSAHSKLNGATYGVYTMSEKNYIAQRQELADAGKEDYHTPEYHGGMYRLITFYRINACELIEKELCAFIHDTTLRAETVEGHFSRFDGIRQYISSVYSAKQPYYQTRVAEFAVLWILMDLSNAGVIRTDEAMSCSSCLSLSGLEPLVEYVFQGMDFLRCVYAYMDTVLPTCKKLSDHPVFREVSFTVEQILQEEDEAARDGKLLSWLEAVYTCWQIHNAPQPLRKAMKGFLQVNYKYLCNRGTELSDEILNLLRTFLDACQ